MAEAAGACRGAQFSLYREARQISAASAYEVTWQPLGLASAGRQRLDREGMDVGLQEIADGDIDRAVPRQGRLTAKRLRHDAYPEMTLPARGAGVSGVRVALVLDLEFDRREAGLQPLAQAQGARHEGSSAGAGLSLPLSQKTWGIMKAIIASVIPNTLKLTQACSEKFRAT